MQCNSLFDSAVLLRKASFDKLDILEMLIDLLYNRQDFSNIFSLLFPPNNFPKTSTWLYINYRCKNDFILQKPCTRLAQTNWHNSWRAKGKEFELRPTQSGFICFYQIVNETKSLFACMKSIITLISAAFLYNAQPSKSVQILLLWEETNSIRIMPSF